MDVKACLEPTMVKVHDEEIQNCWKVTSIFVDGNGTK